MFKNSNNGEYLIVNRGEKMLIDPSLDPEHTPLAHLNFNNLDKNEPVQSKNTFVVTLVFSSRIIKINIGLN